MKLFERNDNYLEKDQVDIEKEENGYSFYIKKYKENDNIISYIINLSKEDSLLFRVEFNKIGTSDWTIKLINSNSSDTVIKSNNGLVIRILETAKLLKLEDQSVKEFIFDVTNLVTYKMGIKNLSDKTFSKSMDIYEDPLDSDIKITKSDWAEFRKYLRQECNVPRLRRVLGSDKKYEEFMTVNMSVMLDAFPDRASKMRTFSDDDVSKSMDALGGVVEILESIPDVIKKIRLIGRLFEAGLTPSLMYVKMQLENTTWRDVCYAFGRYKTLAKSEKYYEKVQKARKEYKNISNSVKVKESPYDVKRPEGFNTVNPGKMSSGNNGYNDGWDTYYEEDPNDKDNYIKKTHNPVARPGGGFDKLDFGKRNTKK